MSDAFSPHEVAWTPEKVGRLWDYYGANPAYANQYFSAHSGREIVERAEREIGLHGRRVLDFGSGRGDLLGHLLARGIAAEGLEFSERSAELARVRLGAEPLFGGVTVTAELPSSLPAGAFDAVFLVEVLEHLLDEQVAPTLVEVRRLLTPGGHVVATAPNEEHLAANTLQCPDCGAVFHRWQHQRSLSAGSLRALFEGHGFVTRTAVAVDWRERARSRLRRRLRPFRGPRPHLLYVGATPASGR